MADLTIHLNQLSDINEQNQSQTENDTQRRKISDPIVAEIYDYIVTHGKIDFVLDEAQIDAILLSLTNENSVFHHEISTIAENDPRILQRAIINCQNINLEDQGLIIAHAYKFINEECIPYLEFIMNSDSENAISLMVSGLMKLFVNIDRSLIWVQDFLFQNFDKIRTINNECIIYAMFEFLIFCSADLYTEEVKEYVKEHIYHDDTTLYDGALILEGAGDKWKEFGVEILNHLLSLEYPTFRIKVSSMQLFGAFLSECTEESKFLKMFEIACEVLESHDFGLLALVLIRKLYVKGCISMEVLKQCEEPLLTFMDNENIDHTSYRLADDLLCFINDN